MNSRPAAQGYPAAGPSRPGFGRTPAGRPRALIVVGIPPLFERLLYYILIPDLFARIVLEAMLGEWYFGITQAKQWIFYALIAVEFAIQSRTFVQGRFRKDENLVVAGLMLVMLLHGVAVGLAWQNSPSRIITDSIAPFVLAANILLLDRRKAFEGLDFQRLVRINSAYALIMVAAGIAAVSVGRPSIVSLGGAAATAVSFTVLLVSFMVKRNFSPADLAMAGAILVPIAPNLNRTTLAVVAVCLISIFMSKIIVDGKRLYFTLVAVFLLSAAIPLVLPPDSPLMRRIEGTMEYDPEQTQGSIGERQAEYLAINQKLRRMGTAAEWFGGGHGAVYDVQLTMREVTDTGHAHFSWALFKLRYGYVGYVYLAIIAAMTLWSVVRNYGSVQPADRIMSILAMFSIAFLLTYVFGFFFLAGTQFSSVRAAMASPHPEQRSRYGLRPYIAAQGSLRQRPR
jgi:hypothetical protein